MAIRMSRRALLAGVGGGLALAAASVWQSTRSVDPKRPAVAGALTHGEYVDVDGWILTPRDLEKVSQKATRPEAQP
jgi:hypothetical protein